MKIYILAAICLNAVWAIPKFPANEHDINLDIEPINGKSEEIFRWRRGVVPYVIEGSFSNKQIQDIYNAMQHYHENTCIQFVPKDNSHDDYIAFTNNGNGCFSSVGRMGKKQRVLLSDSCFQEEQFGTVVHELMHAIGFSHEHVRYDRDDYIEINDENVSSYKKLKRSESDDFEVKYDYNSVLHYVRAAGIKTKYPIYIGQRFGLSTSDVKKIKAMYAKECKNYYNN